MKRINLVLLGWLFSLASVAGPAGDAQQVRERETAFAKTMAERDFAAFGDFISEQAVFFAGNQPLRGRQAVLEGWQRFYTAPVAPFSWRPELVEVLPSGDLALSSGPVFDADGRCVGTFNSIWRREGDVWKVIFDRGASSCEFPVDAN